MRRERVTPRADWKQQVERLGFNYHTIDGETYWDESVCYAFDAAEIDRLEAATQELERLCIQAVDHVVKNDLFARMRIPDNASDMIRLSWRRQEKHLYGRFDLSYDGASAPKMLEYNADTPTSLLEASVIQWEWLEHAKAGADQFNSIHEKLLAAWPRLQINGPVHFAAVADSAEDESTVLYLQDTAAQAGLATHFLHVEDIGSDGKGFVDMDSQPITTLFKLYPWEWLWAEEFAPLIKPSAMRFIEPAWKMLLSNKAILAILWELFPGHPNLLPASLIADKLDGDIVQKPIYGREGANVSIKAAAQKIEPVDVGYGAEGYVYQAYAPLPVHDGHYPVVGSWIIAGEAAGIGIREDAGPVTRDTARFVPHYFTD